MSSKTVYVDGGYRSFGEEVKYPNQLLRKIGFDPDTSILCIRQPGKRDACPKCHSVDGDREIQNGDRYRVYDESIVRGEL